jgi:bifunctional UDP-N-acetylglucosamine pyrophosphorylase/glucosamine-1-phosphate N-acetyltransferase
LPRLKRGNDQGELYLTDIIEIARRDGARIADAEAQAHEGRQISSRSDLAAEEKMLRDDINRRWLQSGVTLEDPATTYIGPDVVIGRDSVIGPNVTLRGRTNIGEGCCLDGSAFISDTTIGKQVHVKFGVVMTEAELDDGVQVGPFAHLRPGTRLGAGVHIGDFVETKNASLGAGTKASHLAYLGDAEIGRDVNVGAGTITCNYDGFRKHRTTIGDRVQIGSDSTLVAPVSIGDDAYLATATTVRKNVAPGALVFNPRQQIEREGWTASRRKREGRNAATSALAAAPKKRAAKAARRK